MVTTITSPKFTSEVPLNMSFKNRNGGALLIRLPISLVEGDPAHTHRGPDFRQSMSFVPPVT